MKVKAISERKGLRDDERLVAEEAARAIYAGKTAYAAKRIRESRDPVVVALAASLALGVLLNSQAAGLKRIREVLETYR